MSSRFEVDIHSVPVITADNCPGQYLARHGGWSHDRRLKPDRRAVGHASAAQIAARRDVRRSVDREILAYIAV